MRCIPMKRVGGGPGGSESAWSSLEGRMNGDSFETDDGISLQEGI